LPSLKSNQRLIDETALPTVEEKFSLFARAVDAFLSAGYVQIGMDHFALPDDELAVSFSAQKLHRNFMGYTVKPAADMVGIGMSAIGDLAGRYAQNASQLGAYTKAVEQFGTATYRGYQLSQDDLVRRRVITYLMCNLVLPYQLLRNDFSIDYLSYCQVEHQELAQFVDDGLLEILPDRLQVTARGRTFIRNIVMVFDAYLRKNRERAKHSYSRTI